MADPDLADLADYQAQDPQQALDAAVAAVRAYCGWHIAPSIVGATQSVWSATGRSIRLTTGNLTAVTSVTQDAVLVPSTSYTFEQWGTISRSYGAWFSPLTRVTVVFTHGYATWPADVQDIILALAQRSVTDTRGLKSKTIGPFSETYGAAELGDSEKARLEPYVIITPIGA